MRKVYSLSLSDEEIIRHLDGISNKSQYIKELIQRDITRKPFTKAQITCIRQLIDEKLKGHTLLNEDDKQREETAKALDELINIL